MKNLVLLIFIILLVQPVLACKDVIGPETLNIALNYQDESSVFYDSEGETMQSLVGCRPTINQKYLRITSGVIQHYLNASVFRVSDSNQLEFDQCSIKNSPLKSPQSIESKEKLYNEKSVFYRSCIRQLVSDKSENGIIVGENQKNCQVKRINKNQVEILGGVCHFKIQLDSEFFFFNRVNKACEKKDFYVKNKVKPQDISASISYSTVKTYKENEESELQFFGSTQVHLSAAPYGILPISDSMGIGKPDWPSIYSFPDINLGKLELITRGENLHINFPFLVDNTCKEICKDGLCSSACNYMAPIAGEVVFSEILPNGKADYIKSTYMGGVAQANWQGMLPSATSLVINKYDQLVSENKTYQLDIYFDDPKIDYMMLQKQFNKVIGSINPNFGQFDGTLIAEIDNINEGDVIPLGPTIGMYQRQATIPNSIQDALKLLEEMLNLKSWPPFYESLCNSDYSTCKKADDGKKILHLQVRFKIDSHETEETDDLFGEESDEGKFVFNNLRIARKSPFETTSVKVIKANKQPEIKCID